MQTIRLLLIMLLGACAPIVPATTPPQLAHTPGALVIVTDTTFDAGDFVVEYPSTWRVVKSSIAAQEHIQAVFVAPDDSTVTITQVDDMSDTTNVDEQFITLDNDVIVQVLVQPVDEPDAQFSDIADRLIDSIRPGS